MLGMVMLLLLVRGDGRMMFRPFVYKRFVVSAELGRWLIDKSVVHSIYVSLGEKEKVMLLL